MHTTNTTPAPVAPLTTDRAAVRGWLCHQPSASGRGYSVEPRPFDRPVGWDVTVGDARYVLAYGGGVWERGRQISGTCDTAQFRTTADAEQWARAEAKSRRRR